MINPIRDINYVWFWPDTIHDINNAWFWPDISLEIWGFPVILDARMTVKIPPWFSLYSHYILTIFSLYSHDILMIFSRYSYDILMICSQYSHDIKRPQKSPLSFFTHSLYLPSKWVKSNKWGEKNGKVCVNAPYLGLVQTWPHAKLQSEYKSKGVFDTVAARIVFTYSF